MTAPMPRTSRTSDTSLSLVIPLYNASGVVEDLVSQLMHLLRPLAISFEINLVDDGSRDDTWAKLVEISASNGAVRGFRLSRNFGQQIAVSAGIAQARGQYLIVMDGDLQNPPDAIPQILSRLRGGDDIVYTVSKVRNNWRDEFTSRLFWFVLTKLFKVNIVENQLMMRGMSARFADIYDSYPESTRTVAGISRDIGHRFSVLAITNNRRPSGRGNYNFFKRFNLMITMVISITTAPLSLIIYVSIFSLISTFIATLYYLVNLIFRDVTEGFTSIILSIFFFGSLITLILGVMGMYLANIYQEVRKRPLFLISERTDGDG